jgi:hypothetical protein
MTGEVDGCTRTVMSNGINGKWGGCLCSMYLVEAGMFVFSSM